MLEKIKNWMVFLFLFLLPTQLGKHFFLDFSFVNGVRIDYLAPVFHIADILVILLGVLFIKNIIAELQKVGHPIIIIALLFVLHISVSTVPFLALYQVLKLFEIYIVYIIFKSLSQSIKQNNSKTWLLLPFLFGSAFQLLLSTLQFYNKSSLQGLFYYFGERSMMLSTPGVAKATFFDQQILRPYGTFSHPNSLGGFYVLLYAFVLMLKNNSFLKQGLVLTCSLLIFLSFSKAAIITYLIISVLHLLFSKSKKLCALCTISQFAVLIVTVLVFLQVQADPFSFQKRIFLLQQGVLIIKDNLFFGVGFGHYLYEQAKFVTPYPHFFLQPVHNIFILFIMQAGTILTGALIYYMREFLKKLIMNKQYIIITLVIIITGSLDHYWLTLQQNMLLLGVILGLAESS